MQLKIKLFDHIGFNLHGPNVDCDQHVTTMILDHHKSLDGYANINFDLAYLFSCGKNAFNY